MLSEDARKRIQDLRKVYETNQSALIPALHIAQADKGWLSPETQLEVAQLLDVTPQEVRGVVTFYTMFHQKPVGKYLLQVCRNLSCSLKGGHRLQAQIEQRLQIREGETTKDGRFTLISVECLGSCGTAPVVQVNNDYHENMDVAKMDQLLGQLK